MSGSSMTVRVDPVRAVQAQVELDEPQLTFTPCSAGGVSVTEPPLPEASRGTLTVRVLVEVAGELKSAYSTWSWPFAGTLQVPVPWQSSELASHPANVQPLEAVAVSVMLPLWEVLR